MHIEIKIGACFIHGYKKIIHARNGRMPPRKLGSGEINQISQKLTNGLVNPDQQN